MFAGTLVQRFMKLTNKQLLGAVFFKFTDVKKSQPLIILKSLVYQLATYFPEIQSKILDLLNDFAGIIEHRTVVDVFEEILLPSLIELEAIKRSHSNDDMQNMVIIFDAIDEAAVDGSDARKELLHLLVPNSFINYPVG